MVHDNVIFCINLHWVKNNMKTWKPKIIHSTADSKEFQSTSNFSSISCVIIRFESFGQICDCPRKIWNRILKTSKIFMKKKISPERPCIHIEADLLDVYASAIFQIKLSIQNLDIVINSWLVSTSWLTEHQKPRLVLIDFQFPLSGKPRPISPWPRNYK